MLKNLIFDVGGVLIGYRWEDMLREYGLSDEVVEEVGSTVFGDPVWSRFDAGHITFDELRTHYLMTYPNIGEHIAYFLDHSELMRVDLPQVWERVAGLHKKYRLYLLSNYSKILFEKHTSGAAFLDEMDGGIISYQVNHVKPDEAIYKALLDKYGLTAGECLFFDDRAENVEAAVKLGIQGFRVECTEKLIEKLDELLSSKEPLLCFAK